MGLQVLAQVGNRKWWLVALLFCAAALNYGDRTAITVVFPLLRRDLGMSDVALAATGTLFLWSYALVSPVVGYLGDRFSRTSLITASLFAWSAVTLLTTFVVSSPQLLAMRVALGAVEAAYMPAAVALLAAWHGPTTRATAMGLHSAGYSFGMVVGGVLAGFLGERFGWRSSLAVLGATGVLLAATAHRVFPRFQPANSTKERTAEADEAIPPLQAITAVLRVSTCRLILSQAMIAGTAMWVLVIWMPLFFFEVLGMTLAQAGFAGTFYSQAGIVVGLLVGGGFSDAVGRRGMRCRVLLHGSLYLAAAPLLLAFFWSRDLYVIAAASIGFFLLRSIGICNEYPVLTDLLPSRLHATTIGLSNGLNCVAGGAGVMLAGHAKQAWGLPGVLGAISALFAMCAVILFIAYWTYVRRDVVFLSERPAQLQSGGFIS